MKSGGAAIVSKGGGVGEQQGENWRVLCKAVIDEVSKRRRSKEQALGSSRTGGQRSPGAAER